MHNPIRSYSQIAPEKIVLCCQKHYKWSSINKIANATKCGIRMSKISQKRRMHSKSLPIVERVSKESINSIEFTMGMPIHWEGIAYPQSTCDTSAYSIYIIITMHGWRIMSCFILIPKSLLNSIILCRIENRQSVVDERTVTHVTRLYSYTADTAVDSTQSQSYYYTHKRMWLPKRMWSLDI